MCDATSDVEGVAMGIHAHRTLLLGVAVLWLYTGPVRAQEEGDDGEDFAREGIYIGAAGSFAHPTQLEDKLGKKLGGSFSVDDSLGFHARVGYRLSPHLAFEVHSEWLAGFEASTASGNADFEVLTITGDFKVYPLTGRWQPYVVAGAGGLIADVVQQSGLGLSGDNNDFAARFGIGLDYYVTRNIALGLDASYVLPVEDVSEFDYFSLGWGLLYRF
jgi:opacity protein-like surface antigen